MDRETLGASRWRRTAVLAALAGLAAVMLGALAISGDAGASHAGGMTAMSIDLDVAGNSATILGPLDDCVVANAGDTLTLDVTAEGIPASNPMLAFSFGLNYPVGVVTVESADSGYLLGAAEGSAVIGGVNEPTPDSDGSWLAAGADVATDTWETGSGVLERITLTIDPASPPGLYPLSLSNAAHIDPNNGAHPPDVVRFAHIGVAAECEGLPTQPPTPEPPSVTPTPIVTASPTPAPPTDPAGTVTVGIDHDGGAADVNEGPSYFVANGGYVTLSVVVESPVRIGSWGVSVAYDHTKLSPTSCAAAPGSICVEDFTPGLIQSTGHPAGGLDSPGIIATMTFKSVEAVADCSDIEVLAGHITDADRNALIVDQFTYGGIICAVGGTPPPQPPEPTAAPTPEPGPAEVKVGIDHDGGFPDINAGPAKPPGMGYIWIHPVIESIPDSVKGWEIELRFDPTLLTFEACFLAVNPSTCLMDGSGGLLVAGASAGLPDAQRLASYAFSLNYATNPYGYCGDISVTVRTLLGAADEPLASETLNGRICSSNEATAPPETPPPSGPVPTLDPCLCIAPQPAVTPTPTPTPAILPDAGGLAAPLPTSPSEDNSPPIELFALIGAACVGAGLAASVYLWRSARRRPR